MIDDIIELERITYTTDEAGNQVPQRETRTVYCRVQSVTRSEFYSAAQNEMHPEYVFVLSNYRDYLGEKEVFYTDWTGTRRNYVVLRAFRPAGSDEIELTVEERTGR